MVITVFDIHLIFIPRIKTGFGFQSRLRKWEHFGDEYFRVTIIINICHVSTHRAHAQFRYCSLDPLSKSAIFVIQIEIILFKKIIGHIYILPAIPIYIANRDAQAKANAAAINTRFFADIREMPLVISIKRIAAERITDVSQIRASIIISYRTKGIIE